jgi:hypothetical protein
MTWYGLSVRDIMAPLSCLPTVKVTTRRGARA